MPLKVWLSLSYFFSIFGAFYKNLKWVETILNFQSQLFVQTY